MNKKIKIIELLNKIANGEEVPNKIKILGIVFVWFEGSYRKENANLEYITDYCRLDCMLNDEIEILEDNTENIEEIEEIEIRSYKGIDYNFQLIENNLHKLAKAVNEIRKDLNK